MFHRVQSLTLLGLCKCHVVLVFFPWCLTSLSFYLYSVSYIGLLHSKSPVLVLTFLIFP